MRLLVRALEAVALVVSPRPERTLLQGEPKMALNQYRDLSVHGSHIHAGFQFDFSCSHCTNNWRSPFQPYRMGQLTTLLHRLTFLLPGIDRAGRASGGMADLRARSAWESALAAAMRHAETQFVNCEECKAVVCHECYSEAEGCCNKCAVLRHDVRPEGAAASGMPSSAASGLDVACPNCRTPSEGGRFCAECGYDFASTHKSCPACSALTSRSSRFCTDCGHAF